MASVKKGKPELRKKGAWLAWLAVVPLSPYFAPVQRVSLWLHRRCG